MNTTPDSPSAAARLQGRLAIVTGAPAASVRR